ncbi:IS1634 family transposase [Eubacteriales bacterium mix99]|jgi:transposase
MYLKTVTNKKTGRTYLSMAQSYRKKGKKYPGSTTVESFGYLDDLQKVYDDPIAHFKAYVEEKNKEKALNDAEYIVKERKDTVLPENTAGRKNFGYIAILKIYYELGLDRLLLNRQRGRNFDYNTSTILKLLVISRILEPASKKRTFEHRSTYFDFEKKDDFSLIDIYRSLSFYAGIDSAIQLQIHKRITEQYSRDTSLVYYDATNYYFEIDMEDELRAKGPSKEHRPDPIVQLGLAMDADGIPISYELFPGNNSEKLHLRPMIGELVRAYESGRVVAVADAAQNTGNNIYYLESGKCSYVFSQTIRGGSKEFKDYVNNQSGYKQFSDQYKRKSRVIRREIEVDMLKEGGRTYKKKVLVDQRQIVFYNKKYADRSKAKREAVLKKAQCIASTPSAYTRATSYGALRYVKNIKVDKKTGEIKKAPKGRPCIDMEKFREDEKYDGYYCIVTNLFDEDGSDTFSDDRIIDMYRGLWRIEDNFRVTKSDLETRPVYVSRKDRIHAHFLICYISLVILRLIQKRLGGAYYPEAIINALKNITCSPESQNIYLFDYRSDVTDAIGKAMGFDFTKKRLTRSEIKKSLGQAKKDNFHYNFFSYDKSRNLAHT